MAVTDLTNTTWVINSNPIVQAYGFFHVNVVYGDYDYEGIALGYSKTQWISGGDLVPANQNWYADLGYPMDISIGDTITIVGGSDVTNAKLIAWLEANATQQVAKKYISSIKSNSEKYYIKDSDARTNITNLIEEQVHVNVEEDDTLEFTVGTVSLLTFTGTNVGSYVYGPYQFEQNMTFEQWVASAYNTDGWTINSNNRIVLDGVAYLKLYSPSQFVVKTDLVQAINYFVWLDN